MPSNETRRIRVEGQVQGVGFRPFVYRLARAQNLAGHVTNCSSHVAIVVQGQTPDLERFITALRLGSPGPISALTQSTIESTTLPDFTIESGQGDAGVADVLLSDRALCQACLAEFNDPGSRRYRYPFISCTACGPRYSISLKLPYDRHNTAWREFPPCADCLAELASPADRRFHQVAISCPQCGPAVYTPDTRDPDGAFHEAVDTLSRGGVLAFKGDSGFQLLVDADNAEAVTTLRQRKRRAKPFALLAPSLSWVKHHAELSSAEADALTGPSAPLVLLRSCSEIAENVAPGTDMLATMLPHSGLQLRLTQALNRPLVATSGNLSGAPLLYDTEEAVKTLATVADSFLLHDLQLAQGLDDSIVRVMAGTPVTLRLGRGLAPRVQRLAVDKNRLGCGAHLKTSIALHGGNRLIAGPYIGDLDSHQARTRYREHKDRLPAFFQISASAEVTDLHPDYGSTIEADYRASTVPHHVAHAMAAWLEHQPRPPFLVLAWDGLGLGPDGTIWGGECLRFDADFRWRRVGSLRPFRLPVADAIARQPGRIGELLRGAPAPAGAVACSSMGRLIEGLASLAGLRDRNEYEAQVAMEWEALGWRASRGADMDFAIDKQNNLDWRPLLPVLSDSTIPLSARALGFHQALARAAVSQCKSLAVAAVLLTGGVFQNRLLVEELVAAGRAAGLNLMLHQNIPPNDGGIAVGQCVAAAKSVQQAEETQQCA